MAAARPLAARWAGALLALALTAAGSAAAGGKKAALAPGAAVEGELAAGAEREIKLKVTKGEAVDVTVAADGVLDALLVGAKGDEIDGALGRTLGEGRPAVMTAVSEKKKGKFRLRLTNRSREGAVRFSVRAGPAREATEADLGLAEAGRASLAAQRAPRGADPASSVALAEREVALRERALGPGHVGLVVPLWRLASARERAGDATGSLEALDRARAIAERELGPGSEAVAWLDEDVGFRAMMARDFVRAEASLGRVRARAEASGDPRRTARAWSSLAMLAQARNDVAAREAALRAAFAVLEKAFGPDDAGVADARFALATMYLQTNRLADAEREASLALATLEKAPEPDQAQIGMYRLLLETVYRAEGETAKADAMRARAAPPAAPARGGATDYVARLQDAMRAWAGGDLEAADRILTALAEQLGDHPAAAEAVAPLTLLSQIRLERGDFAGAERYLKALLAAVEKDAALGPTIAPLALSELALAAWGEGDVAAAVAYEARAADAIEREVARNVVAGSERQKLAYLEMSARELDRAVSLHLRAGPGLPDAARGALEIVLRRKGRALDAATDAVGLLRRRGSPEDRALLDRLAALRSRLATDPLGAGAPADDALGREADALEAAIGARSAEYRATFRPVTLDAVRDAIPEGAALVEFVVYGAVEPRAAAAGPASTTPPPPPPRRYAVYVLTRGGPARGVDLGDAAAIDAAVERFLAAARDPRRDEVARLSRELDEIVMRPVRRLAGSPRQLLVSPDGTLNLVPFAALVDEDGRYLVERTTITYLTSGRDLLRLAERFEPRGEALVFADPDFGAAAGEGKERKLDLGAAPGAGAFARLPGTEAEAEAIAGLVPKATVLTGSHATESALEAARGPRILHLATHGYFLPPATGAAADDPLLRSGLALAGANRRGAAGPDDGVVTALEVAGLDLWGTELAVLSACDTGVGEVRAGDGVYGLRRALVLAGSASQVMSLWTVSDRGTRDLMAAFYAALLAGEGRSEALRRVQLAMLAAPSTRHPYYWASFIQSGAWGPLVVVRSP